MFNSSDELFNTEIDISENVDVEKEFGKIQIISEEEFNSAFIEMIENLKKHINIL